MDEEEEGIDSPVDDIALEEAEEEAAHKQYQ